MQYSPCPCFLSLSPLPTQSTTPASVPEYFYRFSNFSITETSPRAETNFVKSETYLRSGSVPTGGGVTGLVYEGDIFAAWLMWRPPFLGFKMIPILYLGVWHAELKTQRSTLCETLELLFLRCPISWMKEGASLQFFGFRSIPCSVPQFGGKARESRETPSKSQLRGDLSSWREKWPSFFRSFWDLLDAGASYLQRRETFGEFW